MSSDFKSFTKATIGLYIFILFTSFRRSKTESGLGSEKTIIELVLIDSNKYSKENDTLISAFFKFKKAVSKFVLSVNRFIKILDFIFTLPYLCLKSKTLGLFLFFWRGLCYF